MISQLYQKALYSCTDWNQFCSEIEVTINRTILPPYNSSNKFLLYLARTRSNELAEMREK